MASVVRADPRRAIRLASRDPALLVVSVGPAASVPRGPIARVGVSVRDRKLAARLATAMTRTLRAAVAWHEEQLPVVRVTSRRALERLGAGVEGSIAIVPITAKSLRRAKEIVDGLRAARVAGVQLVWNGCDPAREIAESRVFEILEHARATPAAAPVVLARDGEPVEALRLLIAHRR